MYVRTCVWGRGREGVEYVSNVALMESVRKGRYQRRMGRG